MDVFISPSSAERKLAVPVVRGGERGPHAAETLSLANQLPI